MYAMASVGLRLFYVAGVGQCALLVAFVWQVWYALTYNHSFTHSLTRPLTHSPIHPLTHSRTHPLTHSPTHPLTDSPSHLLTHSPTHPLTHLPTHPLTHLPTHPLTHSPTHPLTHLPTYLYSPTSLTPLCFLFPGCLAKLASAEMARKPTFYRISR